jgi:predicted Rossmann fold flavoprotein
MYDLIVVGGGAAGFFGAIQAAERKAGLKILILEKSSKLLTKVKVSGGGRCNVTHYEYNPIRLAQHYPRGEKLLKRLFRKYQAADVVKWFEEKGIRIKAEEDGRMFPVTNSSQTIIDCFMALAMKYNIGIERNQAVTKLDRQGDELALTTQSGKKFLAKYVLVAVGGHSQRSAYHWLEASGHVITPLAPSLFTFNDPSKKFIHLMGVAVDGAVVKIAGTKLSQAGPVLITHWGLSGPAVIRLSAWAAEYLQKANYEFTVLISWIGDKKENLLREELLQSSRKSKQKITVNPLYKLPLRLWQTLCDEAGIKEDKIWSELGNRNVNKLIEQLIRCPFTIRGKTTFKEEFVTSGGVDLGEINSETLESKKIPNLFFAGEVLNVDGETGGFNFQAAWTTAWIAAQSISKK